MDCFVNDIQGEIDKTQSAAPQEREWTIRQQTRYACIFIDNDARAVQRNVELIRDDFKHLPEVQQAMRVTKDALDTLTSALRRHGAL